MSYNFSSKPYALKGLSSMILSVAVVLFNTAAANANETFVTALDRHTSHKEKAGSATDWVVIYCDVGEDSCKHMTASLSKLSVIWKGLGNFPDARFGEVNCAQDRDMCNKEGVKAFPMAVHYRNNIRVATWKVKGHEPSMVAQFVAWVKTELAPSKPPDANMQTNVHAVASFHFAAPFAGMDAESAAIGWCLVLGTIVTVTWVIIEGFELWPAPTSKHVDSKPFPVC